MRRRIGPTQSGQQVFGTHPGMDDRVKKVKAQISSGATGGKGATLKDRFASYTGQGATVGIVDTPDFQ